MPCRIGRGFLPQFNRLVAHLEKHKRYPRGSQLRRQQDVAHRLHKSPGYDALDEETLALLQRAQPLPPPPSELSGETFDLVVPVQFLPDGTPDKKSAPGRSMRITPRRQPPIS